MSECALQTLACRGLRGRNSLSVVFIVREGPLGSATKKQGKEGHSGCAAVFPANKGLPLPLVAGSARPNPKMGAPHPENP